MRRLDNSSVVALPSPTRHTVDELPCWQIFFERREQSTFAPNKDRCSRAVSSQKVPPRVNAAVMKWARRPSTDARV